VIVVICNGIEHPVSSDIGKWNEHGY